MSFTPSAIAPDRHLDPAAHKLDQKGDIVFLRLYGELGDAEVVAMHAVIVRTIL